MAIVSSNVRRYAKKPVTMIEKAASSQLGGLTKAKMGVNRSEITSPLQSKIDLEQAMGRNPNVPNASLSQAQAVVQPTPPIAQAQEGVSTDTGLTVNHYVQILSIIPQDFKVRPIRLLFNLPALSDFTTKAQTQGLIQTAGKLAAAVQGSDVSGNEVEQTAISELQSTQISPLNQRIGGVTNAPIA